MRELVLELMGEYGNLAVFLLILVENLFPPIPSEVILTFGGVMTTCTDMTPGGVILFSTAGSMAGAVILYGAGRFLPDEIFRKLLCGRAGQLLGPGGVPSGGGGKAGHAGGAAPHLGGQVE